MPSRFGLRGSRINITQTCIWTRGHNKLFQAFSQATQHRKSEGSSTKAQDTGPGGHDGKQQQAVRGSIRPFTVLALCMPLGYGVNWALKRQDAAQTSPDGFVKYALVSRDEVSSTCSIFSLIPSHPSAAIDLDAPELKRSIASVQIKQPQLQIARSYTLLPSVDGQDDDELRFLIKREQRGEVSGYLHRLPLDADVEIRGVSSEYVVPEGVEKVLFLAGGTGIAPAMQLADILKSEKSDVHVLWANRKREDCEGGRSDTSNSAGSASWWSLSRLWTLKTTTTNETIEERKRPARGQHQVIRELENAKNSARAAGQSLQIDYFVDEEGTLIQPKTVTSLLLQEPAQGKKLLIVSGPEGFINYWAGPKQWLNGREVQGPISGALGGMNTAGWEILKL